MIYILSILFVLLCFVVGFKILDQFRDGFDWFSGILYFIIFWSAVCNHFWALLCCDSVNTINLKEIFYTRANR